MVYRYLLHDPDYFVQVGIKWDHHLEPDNNFFINDIRVDDGFVANDIVGNNDPLVFKIPNHGVAEGNIFNVARIELADFDPVADAERPEDDQKKTTNDVG